MAVATVVAAALATGGFGLGDGRLFAKGGGLALAGAEGVFERAAEVFDLGLQFGDLLLQDRALGARLGHAVKVGTEGPISCAAPQKNALRHRVGALINYVQG
jgi:hypothetical protein